MKQNRHTNLEIKSGLDVNYQPKIQRLRNGSRNRIRRLLRSFEPLKFLKNQKLGDDMQKIA